MAYRGIGLVCELLSKYDEALAFYTKAKDLTHGRNGVESLESATEASIGDIYKYRNDYDAALEHYHRREAAQQVSGDLMGLVETLNKIGTVHRTRGELDAASVAFARERDLAMALGDKSAIGHALRNLGSVLIIQRDPGKALEFLQTAQRLASDVGNRRLLGVVYSDLGNAYLMNGQREKARACAVALLDNEKEVGEPRNLAHAHYQFAMAIADIDPDAALASYERAVQIAEEIGDRFQVAAFCLALGQFFVRRSGDLAGARRWYQQASAYFYSLGQRSSVCLALSEQAPCRSTQSLPDLVPLRVMVTGLLAEVPAVATVLARLSADVGLDPHSTADSTDNAARLCEDIEAAVAFREHSPLYDSVPEAYWTNLELLARLRNIGEAYRVEKEYVTALTAYEGAHYVARLLDDQHMLDVLANETGRILTTLGQYQSAIAWFEVAAKLARAIWDTPELVADLFNLASTLDDLGERERADSLYREVEEIAGRVGDIERRIQVYQSIGKAYAKRPDFNSAARLYQSCEKLYRGLGDLSRLEPVLSDLAYYFRQAHRPGDSLHYRLEVAGIMEAQGRNAEAAQTYFLAGSTQEVDLRLPQDAITTYGLALRLLQGTTDADEGMTSEVAARIERCKRLVADGTAPDPTSFDAIWQIVGSGALTQEAVIQVALMEHLHTDSEPVDTGSATTIYLQLSQHFGPEGAAARVLQLAGRLHDSNGSYLRALGCYGYAVQHARSAREPHTIAEVRANTGNTLVRLGRKEEAKEAFEEAYQLARAEKDEGLEDLLANQLGGLARAMANYPAALRYFRRNEEIARSQGNVRFLALALEQVALVELDQEHIEEAIMVFDEAEQVARRGGVAHVLGGILLNKGDAYLLLNRYNLALAAYRESEELVVRTGVMNEAVKHNLERVRLRIAETERRLRQQS